MNIEPRAEYLGIAASIQDVMQIDVRVIEHQSHVWAQVPVQAQTGRIQVPAVETSIRQVEVVPAASDFPGTATRANTVLRFNSKEILEDLRSTKIPEFAIPLAAFAGQKIAGLHVCAMEERARR